MEPDRTEDDHPTSPVDRLIEAVRELEAKPDFPDVQREFDAAKADVEALMVGQAAMLPAEARLQIVQQLAQTLGLQIKPQVDLQNWALQALAQKAPEGADPAAYAVDLLNRLNNAEMLGLISQGINAHA